MLLFVFDGVLLLRLAQRRLVALLFQLPPRWLPVGLGPPMGFAPTRGQVVRPFRRAWW
jgi:hypothetical protein